MDLAYYHQLKGEKIGSGDLVEFFHLLEEETNIPYFPAYVVVVEDKKVEIWGVPIKKPMTLCYLVYKKEEVLK